MLNWVRNIRVISLVRTILIMLFLGNQTGFIINVINISFIGMLINGVAMGLCLYVLFDMASLIRLLDPVLFKEGE